MAIDISPITPVLLVGAQPETEHIDVLRAQGVRLIISMRAERRPPPAFSQPFTVLWLKTFDTFLTPIPVRVLMQGVAVALPVMCAGGRVLVHCHRGKHRSVAMAAAILIAQGYSADAAMQLLRRQRAVASPQTWYIRRQIRKFERAWLAQK